MLDVDGINDGSKKINKKLDSVADKSESLGSKLKSALGTGLKTAVKIGVAALTTMSTAVIGLGKIGLEYNSQIEDYTVNFTTMLGDAEKGAAKVQELKEMAANTPFGLADLAESTQTLLAFNVASEDSTEIMSMLGDISLGNADKLSRLSTAYGKVNSTGKLTGETLQQMIEAGFNPALVITQETGETMEEFNKRVSDGGVSVDELRKAMVKATSKGGQFNNGMKNASKTMSGLISTLKDNAISLVGDVFKPISDSLTNDLLPKVIDSVDELQRAFDTGGVNGLVEAAGNMLGDYIAEFSTLLPKIGKVASGLVTSLIDGIKNNAGQIATGAAELVETFVSFVVDAAPKIIDAGIELAINLANGLAQKLPELIPKVMAGVGELISTALSNLPGLFEAGVNLIKGLVEGVISGVPSFLEALFGLHEDTKAVAEEMANEISSSFVGFESFNERLGNAKTQIADYSQAVNSSGKTMADISSLINAKESEIVKYISDAVSKKGTLYEEDLANIRDYMNQLSDLYVEQLDIYRGFAAAEIIKLQQDFKAGEQENMMTRLAAVKQYVSDAAGVTEEWYTGEIARIESLTGIDATEKQKMRDKATEEYNTMLADNERYYADALSIAADFYNDEIKAQDLHFNALTQSRDTHTELGLEEYKMRFGRLDTEVNNGYLTMLATMANAGVQLSDQQKINVLKMLEPFHGLNEDTEIIAHEYMLGLITGLESEVPALANASEMTAEEIADTLIEHIGIQIPSVEAQMANLGENAVLTLAQALRENNDLGAYEMDYIAKNCAMGFEQGINTEQGRIDDAATRVAEGYIKRFKERLGVNSPSRVMREIGKDTMQGLLNGLNDKKNAVKNEMASIATSMANGLKNGLNNQKASLTSAARRIADSVTAAFKARLQIHSPSRVFRDEIGAMMAKGLGEGFEAQMPKELRAMNAAINLGAITTPMMASGTVVPPQSSYSVSRNSNSGIANALSRQISAAMGNQNRTYQFVAQIDGTTVFNKVIREAQMHQVSSGRNPFDL